MQAPVKVARSTIWTQRMQDEVQDVQRYKVISVYTESSNYHHAEESDKMILW